MIRRLNVRQCDSMCGARAIMRSMVRMLVRVKEGIYTVHFRRSSVYIVECEKRCRPRRNKDAAASMVNYGMKQICLYRIYILLTKHGILNLTMRAMILKLRKIKSDTLSNNLMVA